MRFDIYFWKNYNGNFYEWKHLQLQEKNYSHFRSSEIEISNTLYRDYIFRLSFYRFHKHYRAAQATPAFHSLSARYTIQL